MNDFLENPEERINSFSDSLSQKLNRNNVDNPKNATPHLKKKEIKSIKSNDTSETRSVQIRISQPIEQKIRELLLNTYINTGQKIKFREYADKALLSFIPSFDKEINKEERLK